MDLRSGVRRLPTRKTANPTANVGNVGKMGNGANMGNVGKMGNGGNIGKILPFSGGTPDIEKEYFALAENEEKGFQISSSEKKLLNKLSSKQRHNLPELEITDISIELMTHEELERIAVFEARETGDSGMFTVNDSRTGTVDDKVSCNTCYLDNLECPGHVGIIKLNEMIVHPSYRREVIDVLRSVCGSCGELLLSEDALKEYRHLSGSIRLRAIADASDKFPCIRNEQVDGEAGNGEEREREENIRTCLPNPTYITAKLKESGKIFYTRDSKNKTNINIKSIEEVMNILSAISQRDAELLGFTSTTHPKNFILRSLPVIPLCARAPVIQDGQMVKDDLTSMYQDIVRYNNELGGELSESDRENKITSLVFYIEHMINNADGKYGQGKKVYSSIQNRIQGKEGLIRQNAMGKRVDYSARTIIGPDPTLRFGQMRIPKSMAAFLTQHEIIDAGNIRKMMTLLREGKVTSISPKDALGKRVRVNDKIRDTHVLEIGDELDRWLQNGDYVVFNRQPTLHKQGIMGYEVVLGDPQTIGMHLGYTRQHNADELCEMFQNTKVIETTSLHK